ncbi:MAG: hypothetical protein JNL83_24110 [Myxococcales bacterium]|nr:hypothetical protein [Myxococcales bacterium]
MRSLLLLATLTACTSPEPVGEPQLFTAVDLWIAVAPPQPRDVLIVIERSPAMEPYEAAVAQTLNTIGLELARWGDTHIGVVASDSETGELVDGYLVDQVDLLRVRTTNYAGTLAEVLPQRGALGHASPAPSRPLEVATRALREPANTGFRRRSAPLAVVILAATDDASTAPVADLVQVIKEAPTRIGDAIVVIGARLPAPRLEAVAAAMPNRAFVGRIGPGEADVWVGTLAPRWPLIGPPCFERPLLDGDPANCTVTQESEDHTDQHLLPMCDAASTNMPCWTIRRDPQNCGYANTSDLTFEAHYRERPDRLLYVHAQCATAQP